MGTVNQGRELYRRQKAGDQRDPEAVYQAKPGTAEYGALLHRANQGDERAREVLRRRAARGNEQAADDLNGSTGDATFTAGTEPGSFTADQVS